MLTNEDGRCLDCELPPSKCKCPGNEDYDPTPWCLHCGDRENCDCGPIADND